MSAPFVTLTLTLADAEAVKRSLEASKWTAHAMAMDETLSKRARQFAAEFAADCARLGTAVWCAIATTQKAAK